MNNLCTACFAWQLLAAFMAIVTLMINDPGNNFTLLAFAFLSLPVMLAAAFINNK